MTGMREAQRSSEARLKSEQIIAHLLLTHREHLVDAEAVVLEMSNEVRCCEEAASTEDTTLSRARFLDKLRRHRWQNAAACAAKICSTIREMEVYCQQPMAIKPLTHLLNGGAQRGFESYRECQRRGARESLSQKILCMLSLSTTPPVFRQPLPASLFGASFPGRVSIQHFKSLRNERTLQRGAGSSLRPSSTEQSLWMPSLTLFCMVTARTMREVAQMAQSVAALPPKAMMEGHIGEASACHFCLRDRVASQFPRCACYKMLAEHRRGVRRSLFCRLTRKRNSLATATSASPHGPHCITPRRTESQYLSPTETGGVALQGPFCDTSVPRMKLAFVGIDCSVGKVQIQQQLVEACRAVGTCWGQV